MREPSETGYYADPAEFTPDELRRAATPEDEPKPLTKDERDYALAAIRDCWDQVRAIEPASAVANVLRPLVEIVMPRYEATVAALEAEVSLIRQRLSATDDSTYHARLLAHYSYHRDHNASPATCEFCREDCRLPSSPSTPHSGTKND